MSNNGIPDRWLLYKPVGRQIHNTPFVAFKCPLDKKFTNKIPVEERFGPIELKALLPRVSLVIDLTFTTKYYNKDDLQNLGIEYAKVASPGHIIPHVNTIKRFFDIVDDFIFKNRGNENYLIGVHCTHGINRTGFFICSYLINKLGYDCRTAISKFNKARGHKIERQNYINRLQLYEQHPLSFFNAERRKVTLRQQRTFHQDYNDNAQLRWSPNLKTRIYENPSQFVESGNEHNKRWNSYNQSNHFNQFSDRSEYAFDSNKNRTFNRNKNHVFHADESRAFHSNRNCDFDPNRNRVFDPKKSRDFDSYRAFHPYKNHEGPAVEGPSFRNNSRYHFNSPNSHPSYFYSEVSLPLSRLQT